MTIEIDLSEPGALEKLEDWMTGKVKEANAKMQPVTHRGWRIEYDPKPIPNRAHDWNYFHEDYDGPEDRRCGTAPSLQAAIDDIDEAEAACICGFAPVSPTQIDPPEWRTNRQCPLHGAARWRR